MTCKGGIFTIALAAVGGAIVGTAMMYAIAQQLQIEKDLDMYTADLDTLQSLYQGKNIQDYIDIGRLQIIKDYIENGGPPICGSVVFDGRDISALRADGCEAVFSEDLLKNESGRISSQIAKQYSKNWKTGTISKENTFCLIKTRQLPFGNYNSQICFDSPFEEFGKDVISTLFTNIDSPDSCACFDDYKVCWKDLTIGEFSGNFTYALFENC